MKDKLKEYFLRLIFLSSRRHMAEILPTLFIPHISKYELLRKFHQICHYYIEVIFIKIRSMHKTMKKYLSTLFFFSLSKLKKQTSWFHMPKVLPIIRVIVSVENLDLTNSTVSQEKTKQLTNDRQHLENVHMNATKND